MLQVWKLPHLLKGMGTHLPILDKLRINRAATGGSNSARYCYSVWLRHLSVLASQGFCIGNAEVGELGPGDSIGTGLAALLSGAKTYVGLDLVPFSATADLLDIFQTLVQMFSEREAIPDEQEFPGIRPKLKSYVFPHHLIDSSNLALRRGYIRDQLKQPLTKGGPITYYSPWNSPAIVAAGTLDLIFSQAVLEHVDDLRETYIAMSAWLKPGGYMSHVIDFGAHHLSPFWNGHWAYTDFEWQMVRGRREFLLNRNALSKHLECAHQAGLRVLEIIHRYDDAGLPLQCLASRFQDLSKDDRRTRGTVLLLKKGV